MQLVSAESIGKNKFLLGTQSLLSWVETERYIRQNAWPGGIPTEGTWTTDPLIMSWEYEPIHHTDHTKLKRTDNIKDIIIIHCDKSTLSLPVPLEFHGILKEHTQNGLRVLAIAWKPLDTSFSYENAEKIDRWRNYQCTFIIIVKSIYSCKKMDIWNTERIYSAHKVYLSGLHV